MPSPPIGVNQATVIDPPWMPHVKTKVEELSLKEEEEQATVGLLFFNPVKFLTPVNRQLGLKAF